MRLIAIVFTILSTFALAEKASPAKTIYYCQLVTCENNTCPYERFEVDVTSNEFSVNKIVMFHGDPHEVRFQNTSNGILFMSLLNQRTRIMPVSNIGAFAPLKSQQYSFTYMANGAEYVQLNCQSTPF